MLSGTVKYKAERMRGHTYTLYNHSWSGDAALMFRHSGLYVVFQYVRAQRDLWGERISWGEDVNVIVAGYNWKKLQFEAGVLVPFGKYDQGSRSLSKWNRNEQHTRLDMRLVYISLNYDLRWGRQKRGASKLINADASVDHSTTGGR